jgi:hypothetical protein
MKRNYNVKTESAVDVSLLPKAMQVRNFGKVCIRICCISCSTSADRAILLDVRHLAQRQVCVKAAIDHGAQ